MSSFSVTNNIVLRNYYDENRSLVIKDNRNSSTTHKLNYADANALRNAVDELEEFDFENADDDELEDYVKAFVDTYNYTLDSTRNSTLSDVQSAYKKLSSLAETYEDYLEDAGISINSSGYLKLSSSAAENLGRSKFENLLGEGSEFMEKVTKYAKQISRHVDYYV